MLLFALQRWDELSKLWLDFPHLWKRSSCVHIFFVLHKCYLWMDSKFFSHRFLAVFKFRGKCECAARSREIYLRNGKNRMKNSSFYIDWQALRGSMSNCHKQLRIFYFIVRVRVVHVSLRTCQIIPELHPMQRSKRAKHRGKKHSAIRRKNWFRWKMHNIKLKCVQLFSSKNKSSEASKMENYALNAAQRLVNNPSRK